MSKPYKPLTVWLPRSVGLETITAAEQNLPNETGGVLIGYWSGKFDQAVITEVIGPGPGAQHSRTRFIPDAEFQILEITKRYERSGRRHIYLGDWHSHPATSNGRPSSQDKRTLRAIAAFAPARAPAPLMAILSEIPDWTIHVWRAIPKKISGYIYGVKVTAAKVELY